MDGDGDSFGVVAHRAAAHRQDEIGFGGTGAFDAFVQLFHRGIGHDARVLEHRFAALFERGFDLRVNAVFLDRPAAVHQKDVFAVLGELFFKPLHGVFPEVEAGRVAISKVSEHILSP